MSAGRVCPLEYWYAPESLAREPEFRAETLYVIGGLYGNLEALDAILRLKRKEEAAGRRVTLLFNGDFNWFNVDPQEFAAVNHVVLAHRATAGNVEAELWPQRLAEVGCGCGYPEYVDDAVVARSNAIMARLKETASEFKSITAALAELAFTAVVEVGGERVCVVHGDARSLAGWRFAAEMLEPKDMRLRRALGVPDSLITPRAEVEQYFRIANARIFASTHTCLPVAQTYHVDGRTCLLINNGAAGMPNFAGTHFGLITRISCDDRPIAESVYGIKVGNVRCDAVAVHYDHQAMLERFLLSWPKGSHAYQSYYRRLVDGPDYTVEQAMRISAGVRSVKTRLVDKV